MKFFAAALLIMLPVFGFGQSTYDQIMNDFILRAIQDWEAPGIAVTIVKDNQTVFQRTYGVSDIYDQHKTNEQTLWMMGSTTKAVTALSLGILVDQGELVWDDKVQDHLPDFRVNDNYISSELTIRDLLTHRSGMGNTDLLWASGLTSEQVLQRMRYVSPAYSMRSDYTYQNVMYLVAGTIIEKISGLTWESFIQKNIFEPLAMNRTFSNASERFNAGNYVFPHAIINGQVDTIAHLSAEEIAPAGDIWSSIEDMNKWIRFWLNEGVGNGTRIISKEIFAELFKPHTIVPQEKFYPTTELTKPRWTTYGLGWFQQDFGRHALDFHTGSLPGLIAILGLVREENFGVYVFGNLDHAEMRHAIMLKAIDLYLDDDDSRDWHQQTFRLYSKIKDKAKAQQDKVQASRHKNTQPTYDLNKYVGIYENDVLGTIRIKVENGMLKYSINTGFKGNLEHWHFDTFRIIDRPTDGINLAQFVMNPSGEISQIKTLGYNFNKIKD